MNPVRARAWDVTRLAATVGGDALLRRYFPGLPSLISPIIGEVVTALLSGVGVVLLTDLMFARAVVSFEWSQKRVPIRGPEWRLGDNVEMVEIRCTLTTRSVLSKLVRARRWLTAADAKLSFDPDDALSVRREYAERAARTADVVDRDVVFHLDQVAATVPAWIECSLQPDRAPGELPVTVLSSYDAAGLPRIARAMLVRIDSPVETVQIVRAQS